MVEPFNLPGEDTEGQGAAGTCLESPSTAWGEGELQPGSQTPRPWNLFTAQDYLPACSGVVRAASSTLVPMSLAHLPLLPPESGGPSLPPAAGLISSPPPRHSGLELVTPNSQSLLFHIWRERGSAKGDCLGNSSKENGRPGSQSRQSLWDWWSEGLVWVRMC